MLQSSTCVIKSLNDYTIVEAFCCKKKMLKNDNATLPVFASES